MTPLQTYLAQKRRIAEVATPDELGEDEEREKHECALCGSSVSVEPGLDFDDGDICYECGHKWYLAFHPQEAIKLLAIIEKMAGALEFYGSKKTWKTKTRWTGSNPFGCESDDRQPVEVLVALEEDGGKRAREALAEIEKELGK